MGKCLITLLYFLDKQQSGANLSSWVSAKTELAELQKKTFVQVHETKLRHMQERHDYAIKQEQIEGEERLKMALEEHKLKIEILNLQKLKFVNSHK